jgi:Type IV secretion system pilin
MDTVVNLFGTLLDAAVKVGMSAAALFLAWAGFLYMTAGGSPRRMESAKDAAFASIGGLAVVLLAKTIATLIQNAIPK